MRILFYLIIIGGIQTTLTAHANDCVVFVHGLGRTHNSLDFISREVNKMGHLVVNKSYSSTEKTVERLTMEYFPKWLKLCKGLEKIHFVTHSMGGIMVRYYLEKIDKPKNLGHVVMMAPPNHGSELVDKFGDLSSVVLGPANTQLGTGPESLPNQLGPADYSLGIIAGTETANPLSHLIFDTPNDGKVTVESTKLEGMNEHIVVPYSHTFMMDSPEVVDQVKSFIYRGRFK